MFPYYFYGLLRSGCKITLFNQNDQTNRRKSAKITSRKQCNGLLDTVHQGLIVGLAGMGITA